MASNGVKNRKLFERSEFLRFSQDAARFSLGGSVGNLSFGSFLSVGRKKKNNKLAAKPK